MHTMIYLAFILTSLVVITSGYLKSEERKSQERKREFGMDKNFGDAFGLDENFGKSNKKPYCQNVCKTSFDCCDGYKCKRFHSENRYGYCAKKCSPVGPGEDCQRCLACTNGYICTVLLNKHYICLKGKK